MEILKFWGGSFGGNFMVHVVGFMYIVLMGHMGDLQLSIGWLVGGNRCKVFR